MSRDARDWVWSLPDLPPSTRLLLLALAEHVQHGGTCFPGQVRLAAMCGVSERQVRNLLQELGSRGLISVQHRPGQGRGRKSNLYRLEMGNRQPVSACLERQPEIQFRSPISACPEPTGNPAQGNRKSGAGNRKSSSAETEERTGRRKLRKTPLTPLRGDAPPRETALCTLTTNRARWSVAESAPSRAPAIATLAAAPMEEGRHAAPVGTNDNESPACERSGSPLHPQGARRHPSTRAGKRNGTDLRLAEKDYTVGATRDEDLPDWARGWRARARDVE